MTRLYSSSPASTVGQCGCPNRRGWPRRRPATWIVGERAPGSIADEGVVWIADVVYDDVHLLPFAADFDDDGDDDVLLAPSDIALSPADGIVLINNGDFTFEVAAGDRPRGIAQREVLMDDFNGDGRKDFFIADHGYDRPPFPGWHNQ